MLSKKQKLELEEIELMFTDEFEELEEDEIYVAS